MVFMRRSETLDGEVADWQRAICANYSFSAFKVSSRIEVAVMTTKRTAATADTRTCPAIQQRSVWVQQAENGSSFHTEAKTQVGSAVTDRRRVKNRQTSGACGLTMVRYEELHENSATRSLSGVAIPISYSAAQSANRR